MKDLIIIGAGPGGYELAIEAAKKGLSTLLIEEKEVGGTCLHWGCIPTKAYYKTASFLKDLKHREDYGIKGDFDFDFEKTYTRKEEIVKTLTEGIKFLLNKNKVEVVYGYGKIISKNEVIVNNETYQGKNIVIATGSRVANLPLPGFDLDNVINSNDILSLKRLPKKLAVIGGGVVGIEFASIFNQFGCEVEVFELMENILPSIDKEISKRLVSFLKSQGIKFHLKTQIKRIERSENLSLTFDEKNLEQQLDFDHILVAVGRKPNIENIGLDEVGIAYDKYGIKVNDNYQTNISNIYAIGDVTGKMMLAHSATYSGYHVLKHLLNEESLINFKIIPSCVFTFPEVATVGLSEEDCLNQDYQVSKFYFKANGKALTINETDGFVKVISINRKIVGVHIIGPHASDLIHEPASLMNKAITIDELQDFIHAHPTLSEAFSGAIFQ